jgi:hypothetical protein
VCSVKWVFDQLLAHFLRQPGQLANLRSREVLSAFVRSQFASGGTPCTNLQILHPPALAPVQLLRMTVLEQRADEVPLGAAPGHKAAHPSNGIVAQHAASPPQASGGPAPHSAFAGRFSREGHDRQQGTLRYVASSVARCCPLLCRVRVV